MFSTGSVIVGRSDESRAILLFAAALCIGAELLGIAGTARAPHAQLVEIYRSPAAVLTLGSVAIQFVILQLLSRPTASELRVTAVCGSALSVLLVSVLGHPLAAFNWYQRIFILGAGFGTAALFAFAASAVGNTGDAVRARRLLVACVFIAVFSLSAEAYLDISSALHPATFDHVAYRWDATLGFEPSVAVALVAQDWPALLSLLTAVYILMPYGFAALYALQFARPRRVAVNFLSLWVLGSTIGYALYHALPVAGPKYAFASAFPAFMPDPSSVAALPAAVPPAPRNGIPSMHFGWALMLWLNAAFLAMPWVRAAFALVAGLTALATLALGEHYLVDLVVAVPLVVAAQASCTLVVPWRNRDRRLALVIGMSLTIGWFLALRWGIEVFLRVPGLSWAALAATLGVCAWSYRRLALATAAAIDRTGASAQ